MSPTFLTIVTVTRNDPIGLSSTLASSATWRSISWVEQCVIYADETPPDIADSPALIIRQQSDGIAGAFNEGLANARGDWIWFLNGGDCIDPRLTPDFLSTLLGATRADIVIGGTTYDGDAEPRLHPQAHLRWPPIRSWIPHPSTLVRRRLFTQFGPFDETYAIAMDYEWWLRVTTAGVAVDVINVPLAIFAPGGISQRPENLKTVRREQCAALGKHQVAICSSWVSLSARWWKAWFIAQFARRPKKAFATR